MEEESKQGRAHTEGNPQLIVHKITCCNETLCFLNDLTDNQGSRKVKIIFYTNLECSRTLKIQNIKFIRLLLKNI